MSDIRSLEHPTIKVPYENLNKRFRSAQKVIERELSHVLSAAEAADKAAADAAASADEMARQVDGVLARVESFRGKAGEAVEAERAAVDNIRGRLEHLKGGCPPAAVSGSGAPSDTAVAATNSATLAIWRKTRVDRMLVEHFLRSGFYNSALRLAQAAGITELTNISLFLVAKDVEESLSRRDTSKCLSWCHDNKSKMRKMRSSLEFNVRLQEFVELVKSGRKMDAVKHARKHLAPAANADNSENLQTVQRAMALLAFSATPSSSSAVIEGFRPSVYQEFFSEERWQQLIEQFRAENYRLFQLSTQSVFSVALQAGLSSLKTQRCSPLSGKKRPATAAAVAAAVSVGEALGPGGDPMDCAPPPPPSHHRVVDRNSECPVCQEPLYRLAEHLPYAHCSQSRLICYISGRPLNEHNHPLMLPNGFVYGEEALGKMAAENDGQIVCPRSKEIYTFDQAEKVYVM